MPPFDVIVVGLGGMGSAAAARLAAGGQRVLGLEQFQPAHDQGSSHGRSRVIRLAYFEHPAYVPLLYTLTPDHHFVIGLHPVYDQVVVASPCSGHAYKFASVVGEILADLTIGGASRHPIGLFSPARFAGRS